MLTLEMVLLLSLYVFIIYGVFFGDNAIMDTFKGSAPNLAGQIERSINIPSKTGFNEGPAGAFTEPSNNP